MGLDSPDVCMYSHTRPPLFWDKSHTAYEITAMGGTFAPYMYVAVYKRHCILHRPIIRPMSLFGPIG